MLNGVANSGLVSKMAKAFEKKKDEELSLISKSKAKRRIV